MSTITNISEQVAFKQPRSAKGARNTGQIILGLVLIAAALLTLFPLTWLVITAFTPNELVFQSGVGLGITDLTFENFMVAFQIQPVAAWLLNSTTTSFAIGGGKMLLAIPAAFAFARFEFKGRDTLFMVIVGTMTVPYVITLIPTYLGIVRIGWYNSYFGVVIPSMAFCGFATFFLRQAFKTLPEELFEAARIDGATNWQMLLIIALPNTKASIASLSMLSFLSAWNLYLWPQIVLNDPESKTLAIGLKLFATNQEQLQQWGPLMATALLGLMPALLIFFFAQRYLIDAFVSSGIK